MDHALSHGGPLAHIALALTARIKQPPSPIKPNSEFRYFSRSFVFPFPDLRTTLKGVSSLYSVTNIADANLTI